MTTISHDGRTTEAAELKMKKLVAKEGYRLAPELCAAYENTHKKINYVQPGVVYVGHIPHGFYEDEMRGFFSQFGSIIDLRVSRSKKTGRSHGYAFIKFADVEVAKIAANSMNNYMLCGKLLKCELMEEDTVHPDTFKHAKKKFIRIDWTEIARKQANKPRTLEGCNKVVKRLVKAEAGRRKKLKDQGIDYQFPGYEAAQKKVAEHTVFEDNDEEN